MHVCTIDQVGLNTGMTGLEQACMTVHMYDYTMEPACMAVYIHDCKLEPYEGLSRTLGDTGPLPTHRP
jgi:hypothetical protein